MLHPFRIFIDAQHIMPLAHQRFRHAGPKSAETNDNKRMPVTLAMEPLLIPVARPCRDQAVFTPPLAQLFPNVHLVQLLRCRSINSSPTKAASTTLLKRPPGFQTSGQLKAK